MVCCWPPLSCKLVAFPLVPLVNEIDSNGGKSAVAEDAADIAPTIKYVSKHVREASMIRWGISKGHLNEMGTDGTQ